MKEKLYKILVDGKSCHGGDMVWSLPKGTKPGEWMTCEGELKICSRGIHLTKEPFRWYKANCELYEAEAKDIQEWENDKCVCRSARLIKKLPHPKWWTDTFKWIDTLKDIKWLKPDGKPNKEWKLFRTRAAAGNAALNTTKNAAWDVAWAAAWDVAWAAGWAAAWAAAGNGAWAAGWAAAGNGAGDAAWAAAGDVAGDAGLYARILVCSDLKLDKKHIEHAKKRMEVWQKGYSLYCDVNGELYVYESLK